MTVDLESRLRSLGDALDVDDTVRVHEVLARVDERRSRPAGGVALRAAAALVLVLAVVVAVIPSSRRAVADWFGFDGAQIERRPDVSVPEQPDPLGGRGVGTLVDVGEDEVLVSEFVGTLDNPALAKVASDENRVIPVTVNGELGLWIDGAPHEVSFFDEQGEIVFEGFAGNTLLWQDGQVIRRLEGFDDVAIAIAYAETIGG